MNQELDKTSWRWKALRQNSFSISFARKRKVSPYEVELWKSFCITSLETYNLHSSRPAGNWFLEKRAKTFPDKSYSYEKSYESSMKILRRWYEDLSNSGDGLGGLSFHSNSYHMKCQVLLQYKYLGILQDEVRETFQLF